MYDLIIVGGGPAGIAAGIYAARKRVKTLLVAKEIGGQSAVSSEIQNWVGVPKIAGADLAALFEKHVRAYANGIVDIAIGENVMRAERQNTDFAITTESNKTHRAKAILVASGGSRRRLEVPGADTFEHKGVTYCASCDGPLFAGQNVVVVGGGNAGFETAAQLLAYAKSVTLVHRGGEFSKADATTVEAVLAHPHMRVLTDSVPVEVKGDVFVTSAVIKNTKTGGTEEIPTGGIFVEIGMVPNTEFIKELVALDAYGRITVDPRNQRSSLEGIWAAGDVTDELYHQNNIAAGDGVKALEDIYFYLHRQKAANSIAKDKTPATR